MYIRARNPIDVLWQAKDRMYIVPKRFMGTIYYSIYRNVITADQDEQFMFIRQFYNKEIEIRSDKVNGIRGSGWWDDICNDICPVQHTTSWDDTSYWSRLHNVQGLGLSAPALMAFNFKQTHLKKNHNLFFAMFRPDYYYQLLHGKPVPKIAGGFHLAAIDFRKSDNLLKMTTIFKEMGSSEFPALVYALSTLHAYIAQTTGLGVGSANCCIISFTKRAVPIKVESSYPYPSSDMFRRTMWHLDRYVKHKKSKARKYTTREQVKVVGA